VVGRRGRRGAPRGVGKVRRLRMDKSGRLGCNLVEIIREREK
jgi:hypothetical protein